MEELTGRWSNTGEAILEVQLWNKGIGDVYITRWATFPSERQKIFVAWNTAWLTPCKSLWREIDSATFHWQLREHLTFHTATEHQVRYVIADYWQMRMGLVQGLAKHCSHPCFSTPYKATIYKRKSTITHNWCYLEENTWPKRNFIRSFVP